MDIDRAGQDGEAVGLEGGVGSDNNGEAVEDVVRVFSSEEPGFGAVSVEEEDERRSFEMKDEGNGYNQFNVEEGQPSAGNYENCSSNDQKDVKIQKDDFEAKIPVDINDGIYEVKSAMTELKVLKTEQEAEPSKSSATQYRSLLSEFDEYVANERLIESGISRALSYGFEVGDMVWGKVKSHPWWPGHIFNEAFASSSVRRTSRAGHVLVAFFGDSSYGWFDPAELIPFDANFAEKSRQTNSRNFIKAVEEAMDEISRRRGLGLACKCRNKYNFRPTNVQGYFAVDVPDYEQGAYSEDQIKKARESFVPRDTLDFIQQLAMVPQGSDQTNLDFIKNRATVFAYRKAVFEEFDETYAQAFGKPAAHHSHDTAGATDQPFKEQPRAPLSGPLVIAETLGGSKSSNKPMKVKDQSKKDKYLFKRRDDSSPGSAVSSAAAAYVEGSSSAGGFVLQKRAPSVSLISQSPAKQEQDHSTVKMALGPDMLGRGATADGTPMSIQESRENMEMKPSIPGLDHVQSSGTLVNRSLVGVKRAVVGADGVVKKKKVVKRPPGELGDEITTTVKKKKKKKALDPMVTGKVVRSAVSKGTQLNLQKKDDRIGSLSDSAGPLVVPGTGNPELQLRSLLDGLQYLAVDQFHGAERTNPGIIKQSFLRFRSLVYQKSLVLTPASDSDSMDIRPAKSSAVRSVKQQFLADPDRKPHPKLVKPSLRPDDPGKGGKKRAPSDRQEEAEPKKLKTTSKLKSLTAEKKAIQKGQDLRPGEGKESQPAASGPPLSKSAKPVLTRRMEPPPPPAPPSAAEPTMLVMKFPPKTSLPSVPELKARFARFGPLDYNSIRVFWKSSTCRVVFQHKPDAQAAYRYAMGSSSLFGASVRCYIRPVDLPGSEGPENANPRPGDDSMSEAPLRSTKDLERPVGPPLGYQPMPVQLKSCLKKPPGEDSGPMGGNGGKGAARVKFLLGGEDNPTKQQDQPIIGNSSNKSIGFGDADAAASFGGLIYNSSSSNNFQQKSSTSSSSSSLPPLLPLPPQFANAQRNSNSNLRPLETPSRNPPLPPPKITSMPSPTPTMTGSVDISQQMMSLLTRCNDVVTSLTGLLGYVPYHPL